MKTLLIVAGWVGLNAYGFWWELRTLRRREFADTCRRADTLLRQMGFVPDVFASRSATWRHPDGRTARVER